MLYAQDQQTTNQAPPTNQDITFTIEENINMTVEQYRQSLFGNLNLDPTQIPSGILMEYSLIGWDKDKFDGIVNDTISRSDWFYFYGAIYGSQVNSNSNLASPDSLFQWAKSYMIESKIPLLILDKPYQSIRSTALDEGLFTTNADTSTIFDVPNRSISPYDEKRLSVVSIYTDNISSHNPQTFIFPNELWVADTPTLEIDFGEGKGWRTVSPNASLEVTYPQEGQYFIKVRIPNSNQVIQIIEMSAQRPAFYGNPDYTWIIQADQSYNNSQPSLEARVFMGCGNVLDKPVIILEGFDPDGTNTPEEMLEDFEDGEPDFLPSLYAKGYDVIFVNWLDNSTYIEANALALEALLDYINSQKVGTDEGTIIGMSMGGLIARWCLKDMEDRGKAHHIANYFSYDSPHQGATLPLGMQFLFNMIREDFPILGNIDESFDLLAEAAISPAARQMIVKTILISRNISIPLGALRADFANKLNQKGYPNNCNNYGISNGRSDGIGQPHNSGNKIFENTTIFGLVNIFMNARAIHEDGAERNIANYTVAGITFKKIFWDISIPVPTFKYSGLKVRNSLPYDVAPGGQDNTQKEFYNQFKGFGNATNFGHDFHCFVPTVSALDLSNQQYGQNGVWLSQNMRFAFTPASVVSQGITPFDEVWVAPNTQRHINVNTGIAAFIYTRITGEALNLDNSCYNLCLGFRQMSVFSSNLCGATPYDFKLDFPIPTDAILTWSIEGPAQIVSGQGTNQIEVVATGIGEATIHVDIASTCSNGQNVRLSKTVFADDLVPFNLSIAGDDFVCASNKHYQLIGSEFSLETDYPIISWFFSGNIKISPEIIQGQETNNVWLRADDDGTGTITARVTTPCRTVEVSRQILTDDEYITWNAPPDYICNSGNSASLFGLPPNASIYWSSHGAYVSSGQGTANATFHPNGHGPGWIKAQVWSACTYREFVKNVWIGVPNGFTIPPRQNIGSCYRPGYIHPLLQVAGATYVNKNSTGYDFGFIPEGQTVWYTMTYTAGNPCGTTVRSQTFVHYQPHYCQCYPADPVCKIIGPPGGPEPFQVDTTNIELILEEGQAENIEELYAEEIKVYPNPAQEILKVNLGNWYSREEEFYFRLYSKTLIKIYLFIL